jgi:hypothetical protein
MSKAHTMKEKPTTFQLAQLAAQAAPPNTRPKDAVRRARELWIEAETEVAECENRAEFLRGLFHARDGGDIPIFTDPPEEWRARLKEYPGDERDVERAMWEQTFPGEMVEKQLFRDRTLTRGLRHRLVLGLARQCIQFDMEGPLVPYKGRVGYLEDGGFIAPEAGFPIHPKNLERAKSNYRGEGEVLIPAMEVRFVKQVEALLSAPKLYAHLVRWAVEVRHKHLAESKTRVIPESLRRRWHERDRDESIQFKRKFRE